MKNTLVILGALLLAAPAFSRQDEIVGFQLTESRLQIQAALGRPAIVAPSGDLESWQYQIGVEDNHEFSHIVLFRVSTGELVSITRNWEQERSIDELFPPSESEVHFYPDAVHPEYGVRVRRMAGGRVLLAPGSSKPGQPVGQVVLIRQSELPIFFPWLKLTPRP